MPYDTATPVLVDGPRVRVVFTGAGVPKVEDEVFGGNVEQWARDRVAALNTPKAKTTVQVGTPLDLTPPAAPVLTLLQIFERDAADVVKDKTKIDAGIFTAGDPKAKANVDKAKVSRAAYLASEGL